MQSNKNYFKQLKALLSKALASISKVKVASIIVTDKGVFKGVNYEDPVFSLGICAERNAIFNGITNGMKKIYEIHVLSSLGGTKLHMCGACRQVALEFANAKTKVFVYNMDGKRQIYKLFEAFPYRNRDVEQKIIKRKIK